MSYDHYKCLAINKNILRCFLRTATNVWRSFAIITNSWRTAFVSPFALYSPQCETSITSKSEPNVFMYLRLLDTAPNVEQLYEFMLCYKQSVVTTVVPVMNGHPRDQAKVAVNYRWPLVGGTCRRRQT